MILIDHIYKIPFCERRRIGIIILVKVTIFFLLIKILFALCEINSSFLDVVLYVVIILYTLYKFLRIHFFCFSFGEEVLTIYCGLKGKTRDRVPYKRIERVHTKKRKKCISILQVYVAKDHEEIGLLDSVSFILGCAQKRRMYELYMIDSHATSAQSFIEERIQKAHS